MQGQSHLVQLNRFSQDNDLGILGHLGGHIFSGFHQKITAHFKLIPSGSLGGAGKGKINIFGKFEVSKNKGYIIN